MDTALSHLEMEARIQIMGDGVQWEQSPSYHNEVLHCYEDVMVLAQRNHIHVPESIRSAVRKMAYANLSWKKPDHRQFLMGDSDDGDIRDTISAAAWLFHDPVLKFGASPCLEYDMAWDLGIGAVKEYRDMETAMPKFQSAALEDSGNYYLRDGWGEHGNLLHFHCGTMGAGHGHSDQLHVDLVMGGEDVLTDAGRFTYVPGPDRFAFKDYGTQYHHCGQPVFYRVQGFLGVLQALRSREAAASVHGTIRAGTGRSPGIHGQRRRSGGKPQDYPYQT